MVVVVVGVVVVVVVCLCQCVTDTKRKPSFRTYLLTSVVTSFQQLGHSSGAITIQYKTNVRRELIWLVMSMITTVRKLAIQLWTL